MAIWHLPVSIRSQWENLKKSILTLLSVPSRVPSIHVLINLTNLLGTPNLIRYFTRILFSQRYTDRNKYSISGPDSPTYYPNQKNVNSDLIDIFLNHTGLEVLDVVTLDELNSDHNPVILPANYMIQTRLRQIVNRNIRWDVFRQYLKSVEFLLENVLSTGTLEIGIEIF